jgi:hypothetical protein
VEVAVFRVAVLRVGMLAAGKAYYQFLTWSILLCRFMVEVKGRKVRVLLREETGGGYSAQCVELPGAISQGKS